MKLIIAGGRDYHLSKVEYEWLDLIVKDVTEVVSGGARGVDKCGERWAERNNIPIKQFIPKWQRLGRKAGMVRNRDMAFYADALAIFPGGSGTANMREEARKQKLKIFDKYRSKFDHKGAEYV